MLDWIRQLSRHDWLGECRHGQCPVTSPNRDDSVPVMYDFSESHVVNGQCNVIGGWSSLPGVWRSKRKEANPRLKDVSYIFHWGGSKGIVCRMYTVELGAQLLLKWTSERDLALFGCKIFCINVMFAHDDHDSQGGHLLCSVQRSLAGTMVRGKFQSKYGWIDRICHQIIYTYNTWVCTIRILGEETREISTQHFCFFF